MIPDPSLSPSFDAALQTVAAAFEGLSDSVVIVDHQGLIKCENAAAADLLGCVRGGLNGQPYHSVFQALDCEVPVDLSQDWDGCIAVGRAAGRSAHLVARQRVIRDGNGDVLCVACWLRRKPAASWGGDEADGPQAIPARLKSFGEPSSVRTLAEGISHEFNNLLTGILGYAELLSVRLDHDQLGGDYADRIVRAATEARELTRQISVLSGGALLEFCEFDFQQVLEGALQAAHALSAPEIRFLKRSPTVAVRAQGDAEHLQQAIVALLQNACEAMPGGGALTTELEAVVLDKPLAKELGLVRGGPYLRLTIIDEGIGMDASTRRNACEPFFTTKSAPHAGLGLCRALGIIQKHHGTIQIDSEPSHGTSVRIFLPASPRDTRSSAVVIAPSADHATTVLLVEDEEIPRELQAHVLQSAGYAVLAAVDGRQGLELFREYGTQIQLVITDVMMPRMTGDLMVAEMRRLGATVPVMAISGYSRGEAIERLRTLGVDAFVQKPFTGDRLLEQVRQLLAPRAEG